MTDRVHAIFLLFEEGVPEDQIVERVRALKDSERERFVAHLRMYAENVLSDEAIPEAVIDDDGLYARMRAHGQEYAPRLERLLGRLREGV